MAKTVLSKSKYLKGLEGARYLWTVCNAKETIPKTTPSEQFNFDQGTKVGVLATKLYPGGIDIPTEDFKENLEKTQELLKSRKPLFEAAFMKDDIYSRADILNPVGKDEWDIIEVKSGTKVKDVNVHDVSFQKYCYEQCGLKIRKCFLMHLNKEYVRKGELDLKELFHLEDITEQVSEFIEGIQERIDSMLEIIALKKAPEFELEDLTKAHYSSNFSIDEFLASLPEKHVFELSRGKPKAIKLYKEGISTLADIPEDFKLTAKQQIQRNCAQSGQPHIHKDDIKKFLDSLEYPLYYLDFETVITAIPMFDDTTPHHQVPFQFSLHIIGKDFDKHEAFLADATKGDPREEFLKKLKAVLGTKGSVIVYNQSFEIARLKELATSFPKYKKWVDDVVERIVDLLVPFRNFHYYNPLQKGSASIKRVLPALVGRDYEGLGINEGGGAIVSFYRLMTEDLSKKEVEKIRADLEEYCKLDTEGMVWIVDKLREFG